MSEAHGFGGETGEVLRQASVVLAGRPVVLWELTDANVLVPRAASGLVLHQSRPIPDLDDTLRRWGVRLSPGGRWVGTPRPNGGGSWVIAPVRSRPPAPPPDGRERRSRERLALELAGLAVGLIDRRQTADIAGEHGRPDPLRELASLPAMIAHEASNPLAAGRAGLELAMETVGRWVDLGADRRLALLDDLGQVVDDIDRATEFLRAVQDRARGALSRWERFDAVRVVRSCVTLEKPLLRDRGVALEFGTAVESVYLKGDPNALFDLLVNLIRNAADASAGRPDPVEVELGLDGEALALAVRDRGVGIAPEHLVNIFEAGFTTKEFGKGSGMGLALVRRIAEGMFGGSVAVDSRPGNGSRFTVTLPVPPQRSGGWS